MAAIRMGAPRWILTTDRHHKLIRLDSDDPPHLINVRSVVDFYSSKCTLRSLVDECLPHNTVCTVHCTLLVIEMVTSFVLDMCI